MSVSVLGEMLVKYKGDVSDLSTKTKEAKSDISSVGDAAQKSSSGLGSMFKSALSFAGGQAIFAGMGFLKDQLGGIFTESINAQDGLAQTNQVLKSTHDASGMTSQGILDLASQFSHLTKFSDDTVQSGENMLLTFTNIGKNVFPQATQTVLDMSQALGQDTKSSAIQLGKALNDPITGITALQRVGVSFDATQKNLIADYMKHGETAKAQTVILKELQKEFGGSAVAAGKTFGGQLAILQQYLDDIKQNIGDAVIPILNDLLGATLPLLSAFADWSSNITGKLSPAMDQLGSWLHSVTIPLFSFASKQVGEIVDDFKTLSDSLSGPLHTAFDDTQNILHKDVIPRFNDLASLVNGSVQAGMFALRPPTLALAAGLQSQLAGGADFAWHALGNMGGWMMGTGIPVFTDFAGVARDKVGKALSDTGNWIQQTGIPAYENFAGVVRDKLGQAFLTLGQDVQQGTKHLGDVLGSKVGGLSGSVPKIDLKGALGGLDIASIKQDLDEIAAIPLGIKNTFDNIGQTFSNFGAAVHDTYDTYLKPIFDQLGEWGSRIIHDWNADWPTIQKQLAQFWNNIQQTLLDLMDHFKFPDLNIKGWWDGSLAKVDWGKLGDNLIDAVMGALPGFTQGLLDISARAFNWAGGLVVGLKDEWDRITEVIQEWGPQAAQAFSDGWDEIKSAFVNGIDSVIGTINGFINSLDSISIDMGPVHIHPYAPHIPYLAEGGFAQGWFVAGEKGPELGYAGAGGVQMYSNSQSKSMMANYPIRPSASSGPIVIAGGAGGGGSSHGEQTLIFEVEGAQLAKIVNNSTDRLVRLKLGAGGRAA